MKFTRSILLVAVFGLAATTNGHKVVVGNNDHHHRHHHSAYRAAVEAAGGVDKNFQLRGGAASSSTDFTDSSISFDSSSERTSKQHKKHSAYENLNHQITVHGHKFDVEKYKPPAKIPGLSDVMDQIRKVEDEEETQVRNEQEAIHKVEDEYLNSDLHKEALTMKLYPDDAQFDEY